QHLRMQHVAHPSSFFDTGPLFTGRHAVVPCTWHCQVSQLTQRSPFQVLPGCAWDKMLRDAAHVPLHSLRTESVTGPRLVSSCAASASTLSLGSGVADDQLFT